MSNPKIQAAEQLLQSLPNPNGVKEIYLDITWSQPGGDHTHTAVLVVALLVLAIIAIAVCITTYHLRRLGRKSRKPVGFGGTDG